MGIRPLEISSLLQCGDRLQLLESDVCRRQALTTSVNLRAVRVKQIWVIFMHFVGRSSETQQQVGENLNYLIQGSSIQFSKQLIL